MLSLVVTVLQSQNSLSGLTVSNFISLIELGSRNSFLSSSFSAIKAISMEDSTQLNYALVPSQAIFSHALVELY